jgi:antitoxin component YwqK of YwqJK toxin-antitoxin module
MNPLQYRDSGLIRGCLLAALGGGLLAHSAAAQSGSPSGQGRAQSVEERVRIEPYSGPPIFLEEKKVLVAPSPVGGPEVITDKYPDGTVRVERQVTKFSDDHYEANGYYREWYPNGKQFISGQFRNGRQHGEWSYFFDNEQPNRKVTFENGRLNGAWDVFRADGTLAAKRSYSNGLRDGEWINFSAGERPLRIEQYVKGAAEGVWKVFHEDGQLAQQIGMKQGQYHGVVLQFDKEGKKQMEVNYVDGKLDGVATLWLPDGRRLLQEYKAGRLISEKTEQP